MLVKNLGIVGTGTTPSMRNSNYYDSKDIPFIKPSDLNDHGITSVYDTDFYLSNNARNVARLIPANTILCTCIGSIGKIGITETEASCNQQINYIVCNEKHDPRFIGYSLLASKSKMIRIAANGPVVPIINKTRFENLDVVSFDLNTEIAIREKLDGINKAIENKKKELSLLDELIKSRFMKQEVII